MGKRDRQGRETKKPKKQPSRPVQISSELTAPPVVEVVRKKRRSEEMPANE